ncbi:Phosphorylase superfamily [Geosmithia morbida]|uniref:Phosphorylase superfamily n=1 Tax=Geosmithia morbida TaxID=1094350 RepID=A0A9P4YT99_9HYPO|nr:Phosphorylase superfamily [Geosmithia morbida]KAF4121256.1 Phosphorylase superfamily [Geosmithia morbida]
MPDTREYTVGWFSALPTELVAARAFLDEEHGTVCIPNDNNCYTLGKIGIHNVVIAVLPKGECGTDTTSAVARDLLRSFPNVRIGLMVGIGGGAPSQKNDIRLGDVVVSTPKDNSPGIIQYDYGKTIQNEAFRITRSLDTVPMIWQSTVNELRGKHQKQGHKLQGNVERALNRIKVQNKYRRPSSATDKLYKSSFLHPRGSEDCAVTCGSDMAHLVAREKRGAGDLTPAIHYGTIASANQMMMNSYVRDRLAAKHGVLCFETESAGLVNHLPCIVIRGICNYSDTHKNNAWQGYAAMTAAAYAKDLLALLPPTQRV